MKGHENRIEAGSKNTRSDCLRNIFRFSDKVGSGHKKTDPIPMLRRRSKDCFGVMLAYQKKKMYLDAAATWNPDSYNVDGLRNNSHCRLLLQRVGITRPGLAQQLPQRALHCPRKANHTLFGFGSHCSWAEKKANELWKLYLCIPDGFCNGSPVLRIHHHLVNIGPAQN